MSGNAEQAVRTSAGVEVERVVEVAASPETIWRFLVEPERMVRWMGIAASLEPQPGGEYRVEVLPGRVARGEVVELDPPHRLVHTFGWEPGADGDNPRPGSSTVEIELTPSGDGTLVRLTHRGLPSESAAGSHGLGWEHYLARLATAAAGGDPGRDPWLDQVEEM